MAKSNFGVIIVWLKSGGLLKKIRNTYLLALRMIFYAALVSYAAMNYYILSGVVSEFVLGDIFSCDVQVFWIWVECSAIALFGELVIVERIIIAIEVIVLVIDFYIVVVIVVLIS